MPLYDLFHRPLSDVYQWQSLHTQWSGTITADLNRRLPKRFLAAAPTSLGPFISADIAEQELLSSEPEVAGRLGAAAPAGGVAVAAEPEVYTPPATELSLPITFPDEYLIEVRDTSRGSRVVAVVELVSPANKEADARERFAAKCMSYLSKGIGLVVVDTVTERHGNLHNEFVNLANADDKFLMPDGEWIYATAYRPVHRNDEDMVDLWLWPLTVGAGLPVVPLALKGYGCVRLDLEATYAEACAQLRIPE